MVAMPYFQNQLINGQVVQGPYLSGNPALRSEIGQISGTCSCAKQKYDALQSTLRRRFSMGLEYQVAFTYSRGMSDSIGYYGQGARPAPNPLTGRIYTTSSRSSDRLILTKSSSSFPLSSTSCLSDGAASSVKAGTGASMRLWAAGRWVASSPHIPVSH